MLTKEDNKVIGRNKELDKVKTIEQKAYNKALSSTNKQIEELKERIEVLKLDLTDDITMMELKQQLQTLKDERDEFESVRNKVLIKEITKLKSSKEKMVEEIIDRHCGAFFGKDYGDKEVDFTLFGSELKKEIKQQLTKKQNNEQ